LCDWEPIRMNLVKLVDWLTDAGPYDIHFTPTTNDETLPPLDEDDVNSCTTTKPKPSEEEASVQENESIEDEAIEREDPKEDHEEEPME